MPFKLDQEVFPPPLTAESDQPELEYDVYLVKEMTGQKITRVEDMRRDEEVVIFSKK